jgi:putative PIN family toxin of toxin-antitoxin system
LLRAVVDPGVLVSALLSPHGAPARVYLRWLGGEFELIVCAHLLEELGGVLLRPKVREVASRDEVGEFVEVIQRGAVTRPDPVVGEGLTRDPADDYLVALAQASDVDHLVSGDKDLTTLTEALPPVLSPAAFLALL